jgi:DNA-binding MarR family transcriptional regulator
MYSEIVNALDLYLLGRRLMKIGEGAMRGSDAPGIPSGLRLIVTDIAESPGGSIGEIAARTGLPQSYVSTSVARLRDRGAVETATDPRDGRRTLVRLTEAIPARAARRGAVSIDGALAQEAGLEDPAEVVAALEMLLAGLRRQRKGART